MRDPRWVLRRLLHRKRYNAELRRELDATFDMLTAEHRARGLSAEEAERAARRELGGRDALAETVRDSWSGALFEQCLRDVRYALRGLRRNPGFAIACIVTFGLAIGGTTTVATLVDSLLVRALPFDEAERLVMVVERPVGSTGAGHVVSAPNFADWNARNRVFDAMAYYEYRAFNITGNGASPLQTGGLRASSALFDVLRARPLLGRTFIAADDGGTNGNVVILSHALWQDRYHGDSAIIGKSVDINKHPYTVVGVMRREFRFPGIGQQLWIPMTLSDEDRSRQSQSFFAVARLKPGIAVAQAESDMRRVATELEREYPAANTGESAHVFPLHELWMGDISRILKLLSAAVLLVGVMAVVNVAGLLLARGRARGRELGARLALGGSRLRLIGQLVTESVVIALLGAALGVVIARVALPVLVALPGLGLRNLPFRDVSDIVMDPRVLLLAIAVAVVAGLVAGLVPALSVVPNSPAALLKQGDARGATARSGHHVRSTLLAVEVGLAIIVLVAAGLLVDSVRQAVAVEPGLRAEGVSLMSVALPQADSYGPPERPHFCEQLRERLAGSSGVDGISAVSHIPLSGQNAGRSFVIQGQPAPLPNQQPSASYGVVCPAYFATAGIPLRGTRDFSPQDVIAAPPVAIVNEAFQRRYFGNASAVGQHIRLGGFDSSEPWMTIIGVAGDVRHSGLVSDITPYLYRPYTQTVWPSMTVVVRTSRGAHGVVERVRSELGKLIPDEPVGDPVALQTIVDGSLGFMRFPLYMMLAFAGIALLLTIVGVFGVASQVVVQRTRELGIRRALGATRGNLYGLVVWQTLTPAALGLAAGLALARVSGRLLDGLLYGVSPADPATFVAASALLVLLTLFACLAPAHRAAGVDPARTLRND